MSWPKNVLWGLLLSCSFLHGQADSLQQLLQALDKENISAHTRLLLALSKVHTDTGEDSLALAYADDGLALVSSTSSGTIGELLFQKGYSHRALGHDQALSFTYIDSARQYLLAGGLLDQHFEYWRVYGGSLIMKGQLSESVIALQRAETIALDQVQVNDALLNVYNNQIAALQMEGRFEEAIKVGRKAIEYGKKSTHAEYLGDLHFNHGNTFYYTDDMEKVVENYELALAYYQQAELHGFAANVQATIATVLAYLNRHEAAREYLAAAEHYYLTIDDPKAAIALYRNQASIAVLEKQYEEGLTYIDLAIERQKASGNLNTAHGLYVTKADCLIELGRYTEAVTASLMELQVAEQLSDAPEYSANAYERLKYAYAGKEDYRQAYHYARMEYKLRDSIRTETLQDKVAEEHIRQDVDAEQQARENAELQTALLRSRNLLYGAVALALLTLLLVGTFLLIRLRKTQAELAAQRDELAALNRTKDQFFGIIAHDLRSPVAALSGAGEQLSFYLQKGDENKLQRLANRLDNTTQNLRKLLDNLLQWALSQTGTLPFKPQPLYPYELGEEVVNLYQPTADIKGIKLNNQLSNDLTLQADENALRTILRNLVNNALKFTDYGGKITLTASATPTGIKLQVVDTGRGMEEEEMTRIFNLHPSRALGTAGEKGAGLGLTLCRELVQLHDGQLEVTSTLGQGSCFTIVLPKHFTIKK